MRREEPKTLITSFLLGIGIAFTLAIILRPSYLREQAEREELTRQWIAEQIAADRALEAEMEAERLRWEEIEAVKTQPEPTIIEVKEVLDDVYIPDDVEEAARYWGKVYNIEPEFLEAIAWTESRFDPLAVNGGCVGLMQVAPKWHTGRAEDLGFTVDDLYTVNGSMAVAADYLRELFETNDDPYWVLMTYNGDSNAEAYMRLEHSPSEYALNICDLAFFIRQDHEEGRSCTWLDE